MEGPRSRWRRAEGLREGEVLWGNYGLSENIKKNREKPYRGQRNKEGKVQ